MTFLTYRPFSSLIRHFSHSLLISLLMLSKSQAETPAQASLDIIHSGDIPLTQTGAGSYTVNAVIGGIDAEFLLDTGASMVTVNTQFFEQLRDSTDVTRVKRVGARLASGKVEILDVYRVSSFLLNGACELGPLEIAVLPRGGRNLLGMNALQQAAPLNMSFTPPKMNLAGCMHRLEASL
ncbi:retropepsin-like aspartic protease [Pseudohongiella nitratireducens]